MAFFLVSTLPLSFPHQSTPCIIGAQNGLDEAIVAQFVPALPASHFGTDEVQLFQDTHSGVGNTAGFAFTSEDQAAASGFGDQVGFEPPPQPVFLDTGSGRRLLKSTLIELPQRLIDVAKGTEMFFGDLGRALRKISKEPEAYHLELDRLNEFSHPI